jgi:hypothetical protein
MVCASRRLQLNSAKSDLIWFGSKSNLNKLSGCDLTVGIGTDVVSPKNVVRDLGVQLDEQLSMKQHVKFVARTCFYHIRRLRQVRRRINEALATQLVLALVRRTRQPGSFSTFGLTTMSLQPCYSFTGCRWNREYSLNCASSCIRHIQEFFQDIS